MPAFGIWLWKGYKIQKIQSLYSNKHPWSYLVKDLKVTGKQFGIELSDWADQKPACIQSAFLHSIHGNEIRRAQRQTKATFKWMRGNDNCQCSRHPRALELCSCFSKHNEIISCTDNTVSITALFPWLCLNINLIFIQKAFQWSGVMYGFCSKNCL